MTERYPVDPEAVQIGDEVVMAGKRGAVKTKKYRNGDEIVFQLEEYGDQDFSYPEKSYRGHSFDTAYFPQDYFEDEFEDAALDAKALKEFVEPMLDPETEPLKADD